MICTTSKDSFNVSIQCFLENNYSKITMFKQHLSYNVSDVFWSKASNISQYFHWKFHVIILFVLGGENGVKRMPIVYQQPIRNMYRERIIFPLFLSKIELRARLTWALVDFSASSRNVIQQNRCKRKITASKILSEQRNHNRTFSLDVTIAKLASL